MYCRRTLKFGSVVTTVSLPSHMHQVSILNVVVKSKIREIVWYRMYIGSRNRTWEYCSSLLSQCIIACLAPFAGVLSQAFDTADSISPDRLGGGAESISSLRGDDADSLEHGFARVAREHSRVVDPFQAGFDLGVKGVHRFQVDTRSSSDRCATIGMWALVSLSLRRVRAWAPFRVSWWGVPLADSSASAWWEGR